MLMGGLGRFPWKQTNIRGVHSLNKVGEDYQGNMYYKIVSVTGNEVFVLSLHAMQYPVIV